MNFSTLQLRTVQTGIGALALSILTACGGGSSSTGAAAGSTTAQATSVPVTGVATPQSTVVQSAASAAAVVAPVQDSTTFNGVSLSAQKAFQATGRAAVAATTATATIADVASTSDIANAIKIAGLKVRDPVTPTITSIDPNATLVNVYVSPTGNDAWSGSLQTANAGNTDGPVQTIAAAQTIARAKLALMAAGANRIPVHVKIDAGTYYLAAPLQFTPADSGTPSAMVYYEAITPGTVTISGGVPLARSATQSTAGQVRFDVPSAAGTSWQGGSQLFINDRRATLARQPNSGSFWFVKAATPLSTETGSAVGTSAFSATDDALAWINNLSADDRSRAIVQVMQSWADSHHRLANLAVPAGSISVMPRAVSPFMLFGLSQRYFVENVAAAFDAPGEWLWSSSGVSYIPASDETTSSVSTAVMPVLETLVTITGDIPNANWVQNLWFSGLTFTHTRHLVPDAGETDSQAGVDVGAAIQVDGAVSIVMDNCTVSHTSGFGVWFRRAVRDSRVTNSIFTDMGGGGLKFGQAAQVLTELPTGANSAVANQIKDTGKVFAGSVGIWVGQSYDNLISNNAIFNTSNTGISVGWTWGYGSTTSGRNRIVNNLLTNIGQGQLSDMGGIYTVGISPGTVISGNVIREVRGYPGYGPGAWGIYNDEGASNLVVQNNLVVGTDSGGYHLNYGRSNTVANNVFALGTKFEMRVTQTDPANTKLAFQNNILIPLVQQPFDGYATSPDVIFSGNLVSSTALGSAVDLTQCGSGCTTSAASLTNGADPRNIAIANIDSATSATIAQIAQASGPASLVTAISVAAVPAAPPVTAVAPPTPFTLDVANAAIGTQPLGIAYIPGDVSAISIINDSAAPSGKCLAFNDNGLYDYAYYPYIYTLLNHDRGTSTAQFTLKIDALSNLGYEWRDNGNPYKSGPSITITPAGVIVKGQVVAPAPVGQWLTFTVTSAVDDPTATWTLAVTNNTTGVTTTATGLQFGSAGWSNLAWMGLVSGATTTSRACLGSLNVTSSVQ